MCAKVKLKSEIPVQPLFSRIWSGMNNILHHSHHLTNQKVFDLLTAEDIRQRRILDVGSGEGYLTSVLGAYIEKTYSLVPSRVLSACDPHPELFKYPEVDCDKILPDGSLPYDSNTFDAVFSIEVIEHVEDQFRLVREFLRVTKPGGRVIVTTPNILNINSRLRYIHSGFTTLFDPLRLCTQHPVLYAGHIHPINFYYLAHLFYRAGFRNVRAHFDFQKRSGILWTVLFCLPIHIWHLGFRLHMKRKYGEIYEENRHLLEEINRWRMLTSRTLVLEAFNPDLPP